MLDVFKFIEFSLGLQNFFIQALLLLHLIAMRVDKNWLRMDRDLGIKVSHLIMCWIWSQLLKRLLSESSHLSSAVFPCTSFDENKS